MMNPKPREIVTRQIITNKNKGKRDQPHSNFTKKILDVEEITTDCKIRFKLDQQMANFLKIDQWSTFKEVTIGLLRYNKDVKDFYDRKNSCFNVHKYPIFQRFFPNQAVINSHDLKLYLMQRQ